MCVVLSVHKPIQLNLNTIGVKKWKGDKLPLLFRWFFSRIKPQAFPQFSCSNYQKTVQTRGVCSASHALVAIQNINIWPWHCLLFALLWPWHCLLFALLCPRTVGIKKFLDTTANLFGVGKEDEKYFPIPVYQLHGIRLFFFFFSNFSIPEIGMYLTMNNTLSRVCVCVCECMCTFVYLHVSSTGAQVFVYVIIHLKVDLFSCLNIMLAMRVWSTLSSKTSKKSTEDEASAF